MRLVRPLAARPARTQGGPGANVVRFDASRPELGGPADDYQRVLLRRQLGPERPQALHVTEPVFENRFPDVAVAFGDTGKGGDAGLQIGRKTGIVGRHDVDG